MNTNTARPVLVRSEVRNPAYPNEALEAHGLEVSTLITELAAEAGLI